MNTPSHDMSHVLVIGMEIFGPLFSGNSHCTRSLLRGALAVTTSTLFTVVCGCPNNVDPCSFPDDLRAHPRIRPAIVPVSPQTWNRLDAHSCFREVASGLSQPSFAHVFDTVYDQVVLIDWSGYYIYQQHPVLHQSKRTVLAMLRVFQLDEFEHPAVHGVDQVVVLGKYDEQSVLSRYKAPREKVAVYYPPVRSDLFRYAHCDAFSKNVVQPQRYLLCVSRISPEKDTHAFVALVRSLQRKGVLEKHQLTPLICGSIQDADYYEKYFKVAMEHDKLILHENVSDVHRLAEIYAQAAVLVHPARTDAFGMCICEAACFDVPCVVSGCGVGAVEAFPPNHPLLYLVDWSDADAVERQVMLAIEHSSSSSSSSCNPAASSSLPYRDTAITESRFATGILGL